MFNNGKITVECAVCGTSYECTKRDWRTELRDKGWRIDRGIIACRGHADIKWPTRSRVLVGSSHRAV